MKQNEIVMNQIDKGSPSELLDAYGNLIIINHLFEEYRSRMRELEILTGTVEKLIDNAKSYLDILKIKNNKVLYKETEKTLLTLKNYGYDS